MMPQVSLPDPSITNSIRDRLEICCPAPYAGCPDIAPPNPNALNEPPAASSPSGYRLFYDGRLCQC